MSAGSPGRGPGCRRGAAQGAIDEIRCHRTRGRFRGYYRPALTSGLRSVPGGEQDALAEEQQYSPASDTGSTRRRTEALRPSQSEFDGPQTRTKQTKLGCMACRRSAPTAQPQLDRQSARYVRDDDLEFLAHVRPAGCAKLRPPTAPPGRSPGSNSESSARSAGSSILAATAAGAMPVLASMRPRYLIRSARVQVLPSRWASAAALSTRRGPAPTVPGIPGRWGWVTLETAEGRSALGAMS